MSKFKSNNTDRFTLFIILPWDEVCSVRNLTSGVSLKAIYCRLELLAGCPAYTYRLVSSDGKALPEDQSLVLSRNVWDGYMVRVQPLAKWMPVYDGVIHGNLDWILSHRYGNDDEEEQHDGDDQLPSEGLDGDTATGHGDDVGAVALYLSCWLGHSRLCSCLLENGVEPNTVTPFGRSAMFACTVKDNEAILNTLMCHGAKSSLRDFLGETALDIGKKNMCRQCVNYIHSFHINNLQAIADANTSRNIDVEMGTFHKPIHIQVKKDSLTHRKTQSAKITMNSNADLVTKTINHESRENPTNNSKLKRSNNTTNRHPAILRSNTYSNGFNSNKKETAKQHQVGSSSTQHGPHHHSSQTLSTPRNLRYFPEAESSAPSTPRSLSGMATLRVASPQGKYPGGTAQPSSQRNNNNNRVRWVESVAYPELQLSPLYRNSNLTKVLTVPTHSLPNGLTDSSYARHAIDQSSSAQDRSNPQSHGVLQKGPISISIAELDVEDEKDAGTESSVDKCSDGSNVGTESKDASEGNQEDVKGLLTTSSERRTKMWKSRKQLEIKQKERENMEAAKRRIQLSENQKRDLKKRDSFEQWLKKKRRQKRREESTDDSEESSDDEEERKRSNIEAFNNWLKELDERSIQQTNPKSAISLHKRKTRALQGLIGMSNASTKQGNRKITEDANKYMRSYQCWLEKKSQEKENKPEIKDFDERKARQYLDDMRKDVLAEAVSFEKWMEHTEERKTLMEIISESKRCHSEEAADNLKRCQSAKKKNVSFEKWKQELEAKEAKRKIAELRMRRQRDKDLQNDRVSTAIPHDAWVQKKLQEEKQQKQHQRRHSAKGTQNNEDGVSDKSAVFDTWVNKKHEEELQRVKRNIQREQELLLETRQKKELDP